MCAFVLILNVQFLKTEAESKLLSNLSTFHPKLFSKLKRILILANAYDTIPTKMTALDHFRLMRYQNKFKYLQEPDVLDKIHLHTIPVQSVPGRDLGLGRGHQMHHLCLSTKVLETSMISYAILL